MTQDQRSAWVAQNPVAVIVQALDNAFQETSKRIYYAVDNPIQELLAMGDFAEDAALAVWGEFRKTYQAGNMAYNQVTKILDTPCEDSWTVIITTALPAAGDALWLLLTPNPGEILEEYLTPNKGRGASHSRPGKDEPRRKEGRSGKIRRWRPGIPDVDGMIADLIPGAEAVQGRDVGFGEKWLFEGIQLADRVLWYWMLLDITQDFFVKWTTGMQEARFCSKPLAVYFNAFIKQPQGQISQIGPNSPPWTWTSSKGVNFVDSDGDVRLLGSSDVTLTCSYSWTPTDSRANHQYSIDIRLFSGSTQIAVFENNGFIPWPNKKTVSFQLTGENITEVKIGGFNPFQPWYSKDHTFILIGS